MITAIVIASSFLLVVVVVAKPSTDVDMTRKLLQLCLTVVREALQIQLQGSIRIFDCIVLVLLDGVMVRKNRRRSRGEGGLATMLRVAVKLLRVDNLRSFLLENVFDDVESGEIVLATMNDDRAALDDVGHPSLYRLRWLCTDIEEEVLPVDFEALQRVELLNAFFLPVESVDVQDGLTSCVDKGDDSHSVLAFGLWATDAEVLKFYVETNRLARQ